MKQLYLPDLIPVIQGEVIFGKYDIPIHHIVTNPAHAHLRNHTLFFNLNRSKNINWATYNNLQGCVFATDTPSLCSEHEPNMTIIKVHDIEQAYWSFINYYRTLFHIPIIGVTGTCGKAATKEMIMHILTMHYQMVSTYQRSNTSFRDEGCLLEIDDTTEAAVFEIGVLYPGDIKQSCRYLQPQIAVITNIGVDHLAGCQNLESYIQAKAEIVAGLQPHGTLILNADDSNIEKINLNNFTGTVRYYGSGQGIDFRAQNIEYAEKGMKFILTHDNQSYQFFVPGLGEHNVYNALAALATAHSLGFKIEEVRDRLRSFQTIEKHLEFHPGLNGCTVIDDTWSMDPSSLETALKVLKQYSNGRKTIAILGRAKMLGARSSIYHAQIGLKTAELKVDMLVTVGERAKITGLAACEAGMNQASVHFCKNTAEVLEFLTKVLDENYLVLVKTSMRHSSLEMLRKLTIPLLP